MFESVSYITVCFLCVEFYSLLTKRRRLVPICMVVGVYRRDEFIPFQSNFAHPVVLLIRFDWDQAEFSLLRFGSLTHGVCTTAYCTVQYTTTNTNMMVQTISSGKQRSPMISFFRRLDKNFVSGCTRDWHTSQFFFVATRLNRGSSSTVDGRTILRRWILNFLAGTRSKFNSNTRNVLQYYCTPTPRRDGLLVRET